MKSMPMVLQGLVGTVKGCINPGGCCVECFALYVVRNRLQTNSLAFVRDVFGDIYALAGASICGMLDIPELGIEQELAWRGDIRYFWLQQKFVKSLNAT